MQSIVIVIGTCIAAYVIGCGTELLNGWLDERKNR
jgi:hypothetical protein